MNCECNNKNRVKPGIKHVYGNVLRMAIPLTLRTLTKDGDEMVVTDTDFIPSSDHPVRVVFSKGKTNYPIIATMDGNVAIVEDKGKIPVGTYDISVECYDDLGNPYRFKQNAVLYVADTTAEAGIDEEIEYEAQTWYLNAAVFLATTEIGEIGDAIDAKLDDVFGNVAYDANAKEIRFYNKDNSRVLATIDSRPFIADGTVSDVYIDVSRQVLVVVLNEDAGGTRFSVPLYLIFNSYYKKDEVDSLVSRTEKGLRFDFSQELPLVVHVTKNGSSYSSPVDFGAIENAIREDGRIVVACVNNDIFYQLLVADRAEIAFSRVVALDGYQELLVVDPHNVWSMEDVDLGTDGGGGYEPPAGGIPKTDLAPAVQASLDLADSALQSSDLEGYATTDDVDDAVAALVSSAPQTLDTLKELADALGDDPNFATTMATQLGNKVDKETGKGLSTNDYTTAEKTKLAGIAAGAEVNVQADWNVTNTSSDAFIKNKPTLATVATSGSYNDLQDKPNIPAGVTIDSTITQGGTNAVQGGAIYTALQGKADTADIPTKTSDLTNDSGFIDKAMYYGESTTAAATMPKVCTVETFPTYTDNGVTHAKEGTIIAVKFTNSDTNTTDAPELNVNGIGAKAIMYNNAIVTSTAKNTTVAGTAKMLAYYRYDPELDEGNGAWEFLAKSVDSNSTYSNASLGQGYGTQTNSSAATAITSSISSYALSAGGIVTIKFTYDVPANATLNISSKGAKAIYNQGAAITAGVIKAGDTATFIYSTYYHLIAVDSWQDKQDTIDDLATIRSGAALGATALQSHQPLKTINGQSLVGSGNITVVGEKGDKGDTGNVQVDGNGNVLIVNNLEEGGPGAALSAEMGKRLALMSGTYADAWARSKVITVPFCWLWVETVNGAAISKPIWHKGNSVFVDATGAIINVPAASVPDAPTITGATSGSTVPKNTQITITPASGSALYYSIDGGSTYQTSDSAVTLTLATAGSVSIIAYCANNKGNSSNATLSVTVAGTAVPTFSPNGGEVARGGSVTISVPSGGELHYKVNSGAWQTASGNSVSVPITGATTIQAYNVQDGDTSSTITKSFTMAALTSPTFSVATGTEFPATGGSVELTGPTGATIYYTTDGSTPTTSSTQYTGTAIAVTSAMTIKAIAHDNYGDSAVAEASYSVTVDHKFVFKIKLSGDNSTEYVPVSHQAVPGFSSRNYTMSVDWGDGTVDDFTNKAFSRKECSHAYTGAAGDEKTITLRGSAIPALYFAESASGVGADTYGNIDALVAILENTLECDTYITINGGCSSLSADALSNNVGTGHLHLQGLASFPTGLLNHLSKTGITDFNNIFRASVATFTAENMQELRESLASATLLNNMFYGFKGTCPLPDNLFDLIGAGVVTKCQNITHTANSGLTGDAKALYDVLSTKVTSSATTTDCFSATSLTNRNQVPNAWGGTAG